jgi:hypothetical protein
MRKTANVSIVLLLALYLLWPTIAWSQIALTNDASEDEDFPTVMLENWFIELNYHNVIDDNFSSDAITGDFGWYVLTDQNIAFPMLWEEAYLDVGPIFGLRMNSGITTDQAYAENIILWTVGVSFRVRYTQSKLTLNLQGGQLTGKYTHLTGFEKQSHSSVWSADLIYSSDAGRAQGQSWLTAWEMSVIGSTPWAPQVPLDWGFNELTHNVGRGATNTYSVHTFTSLDVIDLPLSDIMLMPLSIKGSAGKYGDGIKYFGLGAGVGVVVNNRPAAGLYIDKLWGWDNSKFDNWNLNFRFHLSFFETIWWGSTEGEM